MLSHIRSSFSDCADFYSRELTVGDWTLSLCFFKGMTDRGALGELVLRPLLAELNAGVFDGDFFSLLRTGSVRPANSPEAAEDALLRGEVLLVARKTLRTGGEKQTSVLVNLQTGLSRSVSEPNSDVTIRGPRVGFVEDVEKNMTLLRQSMRTGDLKFLTLEVGKISHTRVVLAYLDSRADKALISELSARICNLKAEALTDSGNLEMLLLGKRSPLFPVFGSTEKADKAASKLLAGRIGILVDGSPFVLTVPYVFAESIQSAEDYLHTPYYATAIRLVRFLSVFLSLFLPALLVACGKISPEALPDGLRKQLSDIRNDLPTTLFLECLTSLLVFELVREVGVRMPRTVGDAVGIVASIILGDAAVEAGLASPIVILAVALSAVCAFIVPAYMYVTVLLRFLFLVAAELFGFAGLFLGLAILLTVTARLESFGAPYLSPLSPWRPKGLEDFLLAIPKKTLGRKETL